MMLIQTYMLLSLILWKERAVHHLSHFRWDCKATGTRCVFHASECSNFSMAQVAPVWWQLLHWHLSPSNLQSHASYASSMHKEIILTIWKRAAMNICMCLCTVFQLFNSKQVKASPCVTWRNAPDITQSHWSDFGNHDFMFYRWIFCSWYSVLIQRIGESRHSVVRYRLRISSPVYNSYFRFISLMWDVCSSHVFLTKVWIWIWNCCLLNWKGLKV